MLAVASCAPKAPAPPGPVPPAPGIERPADRPLPTATYFMLAASIDLYQVRAGELALQRSANRYFAQRMVDEHRGLASQLSMAGRRLNLLPPNTLQPEQQAWLDELNGLTGAQFDAAYTRQQRTAHDRSYRIHAAYAYGGESATLRPVARNAAGVEQQHIRQLRSL